MSSTDATIARAAVKPKNVSYTIVAVGFGNTACVKAKWTPAHNDDKIAKIHLNQSVFISYHLNNLKVVALNCFSQIASSMKRILFYGMHNNNNF